MLLYHGSKSGIQGDIRPDYKSNRETCDFGKGFYLGDMPDQPKGLIANRINGRYYEIEYNAEGLNVLFVVLRLLRVSVCQALCETLFKYF